MISFGVYPSEAQNNTRYVSLRDSVLFCEMGLELACGIAAANVAHVIGSHFRATRQFAAKIASRLIVSAFSVHICNVFKVSTQKQMSRIDTGWIIARVTDFHAIGDGAIMNNPRYAVGVDALTLTVADDAVPLECCCRPQPTAIWPVLVDFLPEPIKQWAATSMTNGKAHWLALYNAFCEAIAGCNARLVATTALAITRLNFFDFKRGWDILLHDISSLLAGVRAGDALTSPGVSIAFLLLYFTIFERVEQAEQSTPTVQRFFDDRLRAAGLDR